MWMCRLADLTYHQRCTIHFLSVEFFCTEWISQYVLWRDAFALIAVWDTLSSLSSSRRKIIFSRIPWKFTIRMKYHHFFALFLVQLRVFRFFLSPSEYSFITYATIYQWVNLYTNYLNVNWLPIKRNEKYTIWRINLGHCWASDE